MRSNLRLVARVAGLKRQWFEWQLEFRTELSIHGLFDDSEAPHDGTNLEPCEMAAIIQRRVEILVEETRNSLGHSPETPYLQKQSMPTTTTSMLIATPTLVQRMDSDIIEGMTVDRRDIVCDRAIQISGCYVRLTVRRFLLENGNTIYRISAYDPRECERFLLSVDDATGRDLFRNGGATDGNNKRSPLVEKLRNRLAFSSVSGKRRLQLGTDLTVAVRGSDPEEEMARLMGTGTQKQELDRIKRDVKQGLEEVDGEVMDEKLVKGAIFTEMKQFDTPSGKQLLTVRLLDELGVDQNSGTLVVYCSNQRDGRIRYRLVISRADIESLIPGGMDKQGSRRRLCRLILSHLAVKSGIMVLAPTAALEEDGRVADAGGVASTIISGAKLDASVGGDSGSGIASEEDDLSSGDESSCSTSTAYKDILDINDSADSEEIPTPNETDAEARIGEANAEVAETNSSGSSDDVDFGWL
jgi:hypothetical protein